MTVQGWHQVARRGPGHRTSACLKGTRSPDISLFEGDSVTGHQSARKGSGHRITQIMNKTILITGFQPFGGESINPSYEAVKRLPDD